MGIPGPFKLPLHPVVSLLWGAALACGGSGPGAATPPTDGGESTADAGPPEPCPTPATGPVEIWVDDRDDGADGSGSEEDPFRTLQAALDAAGDGATLHIAPGEYRAEPRDFVDPTHGNCGDEAFHQDIPATVGFHVRCKAVTLSGAGAGEDGTVLITGAGYGVLFEHAGSSRVENLRITGGERDADGGATDGAIVARYTELEVRDVDIIDNDDLFYGEPDPVVGVAGIVGREGAKLSVRRTRILNSSWDGIALYRGDPDDPASAPEALIEDVEVGCTHERSDCIARSGRGVGLGTTCGARSTIRRAEVYGYWKGIASFAGSEVEVENSVVRDQVAWGVAVGGDARMDVTNSVIAGNGEAGVAVTATSARGRYTNNLVVGNGHRNVEQILPRAGFWSIADDPELFELEYNAFWNNEPHEACADGKTGETPCTPLDLAETNLEVAPEVGDDFAPLPESPLIDAGDPDILDPDGSRSDIGRFGGPAAPER